jgi:hypothetical protein
VAHLNIEFGDSNVPQHVVIKVKKLMMQVRLLVPLLEPAEETPCDISKSRQSSTNACHPLLLNVSGGTAVNAGQTAVLVDNLPPPTRLQARRRPSSAAPGTVRGWTACRATVFCQRDLSFGDSRAAEGRCVAIEERSLL